MSPLSNELRNILEHAVIRAREVAEEAAKTALTILAVKQDEAFASLSPEQRRLRIALRAKARQLGNGDVEKGFQPLIEEVAYEQWHCRLFARFLAENSLLIHPTQNIAITLAECSELAVEEGISDMWQLAVCYSSAMLPGIFPIDDPAMQIRFSPEGRHKLEYIITDLPSMLFTADDALGWVYQFWQTKKKKEVNESRCKISSRDIPPVTQLFTEHYMVQFLLENSLGAWWAARHPTSSLLKNFTYLRFKDDGTPATGTFPGWPEHAAEITVMDPCCGSGHFLVAAFEMLYQMRMEEEKLSETQAAHVVLRDNLFGLELDHRCTQIAAFALALAAWKVGGYRELPIPNIACSGIPVVGQLETWTRLAGDDINLRLTLERHYHLFRSAPDLGSLINPNDVPLQDRMFTADYAVVEPLLAKALSRERNQNDPVSTVFGAAAEGVAKAAKLLAGTYTLVTTNVPYLKRGKQNEILKQFCDKHHPKSLADLATVFIERCSAFTKPYSSYAIITPQNWLFLNSYNEMRIQFLKEQAWNHISRLGTGAFETISGEVVNIALLIASNCAPINGHTITGLDVSGSKTISQKIQMLHDSLLKFSKQHTQLRNPDARISLEETNNSELLDRYADAYAGIRSGDYPRFGRCFWEMPRPLPGWVFQYSTVSNSCDFGGCEHVLLWESGEGQLAKYQAELALLRYASGGWKQGRHAWGRKGVIVSQMGKLPCALYTGEMFDNNCAVIVPKDPKYLPAIWAFCQSSKFNEAVRQVDQALKVTNASLVKVPFDLEYWQEVADVAGPLPEPYSNDPTQWLFNGNPIGATEPLQVTVAHLLGYRWPQQKSDVLDDYPDKDSIICLPSVIGEDMAVNRLRTLLATAYGEAWSPKLQDLLLRDAGFSGKSLEIWLRDGFFEQHCRLFHNRPFIWHIWDGRKDGFSALVNYHQLDAAGLERLIYKYLGSWIATQRADQDAGIVGAEARLIAASKLQKKLEAIRTGELYDITSDPYDIYVRWKPLHEQPIGWNPDLNDGVRINIRPFVEAGVLRRQFTINWNKDRGTNPDGSERLNHLHYALAQKHESRLVSIQ